MKKQLKYTVVALTLVAAMGVSGMLTGCGTSSKDNSNDSSKETTKDAAGWDLADSIVEDVKNNEPEFDDYEVSIVDFGAEVKSEKITDKTAEAELAKSNGEAIKKAIADVSSHKGDNGKVGGKVVIPKGYVYTGAIHLDDNVELHLEDDAYLMFTTDYSQYENVLTRWEGIVCYNYSPMIYAYQKKNIAITGNGVIDA